MEDEDAPHRRIREGVAVPDPGEIRRSSHVRNVRGGEGAADGRHHCRGGGVGGGGSMPAPLSCAHDGGRARFLLPLTTWRNELCRFGGAVGWRVMPLSRLSL